MTAVERHLVRARDLADRAYAEPLEVADLARAAGLSPAHFSRKFREAFGMTPHGYLLTRRLERAAALLRNTDHSVARICVEVGLSSLGSLTSSFTRTYTRSPTAYRDAFPPVADRVPLSYLAAIVRWAMTCRTSHPSHRRWPRSSSQAAGGSARSATCPTSRGSTDPALRCTPRRASLSRC
jgi:AraC-like DNA-binding protein